jgi:phosphocarrier protein
MEQSPPGVREELVKIRNKQGLHLRLATAFALAAQKYQSDITVGFEGQQVDGKSSLSLITLVALCGADLAIRAEGPDADAAADELVALVENGLGAEPKDLV